MKRVITGMLCCVILATSLCGCSDHSITASPDPAPTDSIVQTPDAPAEEMPVERINPAEKDQAENIVPFGNVPGIIVGVSDHSTLPNFSENPTRKWIYFESDHITFGAEHKTYLVDGYIEKAEKLLLAVQEATGLTFAPSTDKICIYLQNDGDGDSDFDYGANVDGPARMVQMPQADAFIGKSSDLIACLAKILQTDNAPSDFIDVLDFGFQAYTAYNVLDYLEQTDPDFAACFAHKHSAFWNYYIHDPDTLYSQPITYWMENGYPYDVSSGSTAVGFWLMMYLDQVYGNCTQWITGNGTSVLTPDAQIQSLQTLYADNVYDGFYPWLKQNMPQFDPAQDVPDYTWLTAYTHYPTFAFSGYTDNLISGNCNGLLISLAEFRHYMTDFKGYDAELLTLRKFTDHTISLYDAEGNFITATKGVQTADWEYLVFLDDAYYIRIEGDSPIEAMLSYSNNENGAG